MNFSVNPKDLEASTALTPSPAAIVEAGTRLADALAQGRAIDTAALRAAMEAACGGSDAEGFWLWKDAYEAGEVAQILFLRRFWPAIRAKATTPAGCLAMLGRIVGLLPTHTRRSEESEALQQFSTPLPLGYVAALACGLRPGDVVLEPSAGTGLLAIHAELAGAQLHLNELAATRAGLLRALYPAGSVAQLDAAQIHDRLDPGVTPTVILMNPPFSVAAGVEGRYRDATAAHLRAALTRLTRGGAWSPSPARTSAPIAPRPPMPSQAWPNAAGGWCSRPACRGGPMPSMVPPSTCASACSTACPPARRPGTLLRSG